MSMTILDCTNNLLKEPPCFFFFHFSSFDNVVEELVPGVLDHHDDVGRGRYDFVPGIGRPESEEWERQGVKGKELI